MAASGFTPISLYYSTTASAVPTSGNLANGELGLNIADMKLYAKNSAGVVTLLASNGSTGATVSSVSGTGTVNGLTLTGTVTTSGSLTLGGTLSLVSPPPIGSTSPNTGAFTTLSATKGSAGLVAFFLSGNAAQSPYISFGRAAEDLRIQIAAATNDLLTGTVAGDYATNSNGSIWFGTGGNPITKISSTGLAVTGTLSATGGTSVATSSGYLTVGTVSATGMNASDLGIPNNKYLRATVVAGTSSVALIGLDSGNIVQINANGASGGTNVTGTLSSTNYGTFKNLRIGLDGSNDIFNGSAANTYYSTSTNSYGHVFGNSGGGNYCTLAYTQIIFNTSNVERVRVQTGLSVGTASDPGAGAIYATGAITAFFSDKRLKTVSGKIKNALDKVGKLSGVYYTFNDTAKSFGYDSDEVQVGVIAQEVEAVLPQIVKAAPFDLDENNNSKSGENYKTVQYDKLTPLLIEAINELRAEVTALKGTI